MVDLFKFLQILFLLGSKLLAEEQEKKANLTKMYNNCNMICTVELMVSGSEKIAIIQTIREFTDLDLTESKEAVENPPTVLCHEMPLGFAKELKIRLEKLETYITITDIRAKNIQI